MWWWQAIQLFWLPGAISYYISHPMSFNMLHPICLTSLDLCRQINALGAFLTSIIGSSIHCILLCVLSPHCDPRLSGEYLHLWNASRWRSMKTMYASFATWSTAIRVRMGERLGAGWRGSLHTDCQCLGESWFPQARGQAELLQEWGWSS